MKNMGKLLKEILMCEDLYSSEIVNRVPVDIENTSLGNDMMTLLDLT
jgi:hypothetical protein